METKTYKHTLYWLKLSKTVPKARRRRLYCISLAKRILKHVRMG